MSRFAVLASCLALVPACRYSLEDDASSVTVDSGIDAPISVSCMEATTHSDLAFIETTIFAKSCSLSSACHSGANNAAGRLDLRVGASFQTLVGKTSVMAPTYKYVVPNRPNESHLLLMIQHIAPEMMSPPTTAPDPQVGYMPKGTGNRPMCVEKRDAIERWILAGAPAS